MNLSPCRIKLEFELGSSALGQVSLKVVSILAELSFGMYVVCKSNLKLLKLQPRLQ